MSLENSSVGSNRIERAGISRQLPEPAFIASGQVKENANSGASVGGMWPMRSKTRTQSTKSDGGHIGHIPNARIFAAGRMNYV